jgi:hypothetical protein
MAATANLYGLMIGKAFNKEIDLDSDTIKVALLTSAYTPAQDTDAYWSDVSSHEASGTGYTAGGATLASKTVAYDAASNTFTFDAADTVWSDSTVTARYAVIYDAQTGTPASEPLLAFVDFGADQSSSAGTFTITWNASGIFTLTVD